MHPTLTYRPDLQGLRALAILLVVLGHCGVPALGGGFVGVDVFFVLSGYLITGLLLRERSQSGRIDVPAFIARRLRRLLPALAVMIVVVSAAAWQVLSPYEAGQQTASLPYAVTWTSNLYFALTTFDYFAGSGARDLFLHTWSLGVEEQFYLLWPLFLLGVLASRRYRGRPAPLLAAAFAAAFVLGLSLELAWMRVNTLWAFYLMPARTWQFALGALTFLWTDRSPAAGRDGTGRRRRHAAAAIVGLAAILGSALVVDGERPYPGLYALLPSCGAALVIAAGPAVGGLLGSRLPVWLGDRSYSLYLWHWPVLVLGSAWLRPAGAPEIAALVLLSAAIAEASYRYVERPLWKGRLAGISPRLTVLGAALSMLLVAFGAERLAQAGGDDAAGRGLPLAAAARDNAPVIYERGCDSWIASAELQPCIAGSPHAARTVLLLGDSIGAQWYGLLPEIFATRDWRIVVLTKSACPMVDQDYFYRRIGRVYDVCREWRAAALDYAEQQRPDVVFVGSSADYPFTADEWTDGSARVIARLARAAGDVIVIPGNPTLSFDGPACLERRGPESAAACREPVVEARYAAVAGYLAEAADGYANVHVLDLAGLVCPGGVCAASDADGRPVFRDHQHLSDVFVRAQAGPVMQQLAERGLLPDLRARLDID